MPSLPKLGIICDDPPVNETVIAHGMCRVNARLIRALSHSITQVATATYSNGYRYQDLIPDIQDRYISTEFPRLLQKGLGRFLPQIRNRSIAFHFKLSYLVKQLHQTETDWVFCPCGANPTSLERGVKLAQASNLPLALYLVDDFLESAILSGNQHNLQLAQQQVPQWLEKTEKVFVISPGLRQLLLDRYGIDSVVLPLPYELPPAPPAIPSLTDQIIFVGSLSHFYIEGLKQLAALLDQFHQETGTFIALRLTTSNSNHAKKVIGNFHCLRCQPCHTPTELYQEIASSLFCFAPYSFEKKYEAMVRTSFPSKMMDYLAASSLIVVYAPAYSSSAQYFNQHNLPLWIDNQAALHEVIIEQLQQRQHYGTSYREVVQRYHALAFIRNTIIGTLSYSLSKDCTS